MEVDRPSFLQGLHRASQKADCRSSHSRNSRRVFRLPRLFNKDASASRFVDPKINSAQTNPRGKSKEGGRSPLLGRFKGVCKGARAPTRIQRSDSCGKRRNNGTDDACPPQAADRMRDVEFVPTQIPLCYSFFRPSTALSFSYEKESGVETVPFLTSQKKVCRRRHALCRAKARAGMPPLRMPSVNKKPSPKALKCPLSSQCH